MGSLAGRTYRRSGARSSSSDSRLRISRERLPSTSTSAAAAAYCSSTPATCHRPRHREWPAGRLLVPSASRRSRAKKSPVSQMGPTTSTRSVRHIACPELPGQSRDTRRTATVAADHSWQHPPPRTACRHFACDRAQRVSSAPAGATMARPGSSKRCTPRPFRGCSTAAAYLLVSWANLAAEFCS